MPKKNKKTILIVDDDASIIDVYSIALIASGFKVIKAVNGEEGLKVALSEVPDLILLDVLMPVMDGFTMLEKLKQVNEYGKKVPVIMLTNLSAGDENIIRKVAQTGPVYYIVKSSMGVVEVVDKVKDQIAALSNK